MENVVKKTIKKTKLQPKAKLRDYLNSEEGNHFLFLKITALHLKAYREQWAKYGNITPEEHKELKMAETYLNKFITTLESRLSDKTKDVFNKKQYNHAVKIMDKYTMDRLKGTIEKELKIVHMPREEFEDWTTEMMAAVCKNCTKDYKKCYLHDTLLANFVPESGENCENCRFAYRRENKKDDGDR
jgi:phage pi2 protein 07